MEFTTKNVKEVNLLTLFSFGQILRYSLDLLPPLYFII